MSRSRTSCFICGFDPNENRFYSFPQDECRRLQWATAVRIPVNDIPRYSKLCQKHFLDDDFHTPNFVGNNMKIRLKQTAVPSRLLESMKRRRWKLPLKNHFQPHPPVLAENNHVPESPDPVQNNNVCVICGTNKGQHVSYHLFPNSDERKKDWLLACNIDQEDYRPTMRVCSIHFKPHEVRNNSQRHRLIAGSVPSLWLPNENLMSFESIFTTSENGDFHNSVAAQVEDCSNRSDNSESSGNLMDDDSDTEMVNSTDISQMGRSPTRYSMLSVSVQSSPEQNSTFTPQSTEGSTAKLKKNRVIRYPGDISTLHLFSPSSARSSVNCLKEAIKKLRREKKTMAQKLRRANETIRNLKGVVAQLKATNFVSEELNDQLYVSSY